ncbi:MAG TPA: SxtJ family membrane protein [Vicinamibacterales bacterium]|nr:SxtJ family membrane protein [Vicinamibacterales bacterium]
MTGDASTPRDRSRDTGLALVLLLLIAQLATGRQGLITAAVVALVVAMTAPLVFRPLSVVWFALSHLLGTVMSKVLLGAVFYLIVTPVGVARRLLGHDSLRLRAFKGGDASVMHVRQHVFVPDDLDKPY